METNSPPKPALRAANQLGLGPFINATIAAGEKATDLSQLLEGLGKQLIEHANCGILFSIDFLDPNTPKQLEVVATSFNECPQNLQQWACTTAIKAMATGQVVLENSTSAQSQTVSMISIPLGRHTKNRMLSALFIGNSAEQCLPFMQLVIEQVGRWESHERLYQERQTSLDIAALQEISFAAADSKSTQQGCRKLANNLKEQLLSMTDQTELTIYIGKNSNESFPKLIGVSDSDSLPEDATLVEAIESAMAECISRNTETCWPAEGDNFANMCHKRLFELLDDEPVASYVLPDSLGEAQAVLTVQSPVPLNDRLKNFLATAQSQLGVAVSLADRNEKNRLQKMFDQLKKTLKEEKTKTICKVLLGVFLLGMIPLPYQIKATSEVQPAEKMFLYAPFSAPLKQSLVEPGDLVLKDAELAQLDDNELTLELAEVQADLHRAQKKRDGFVATHEPGEARMARHEAEVLEARLEILEQRAEQLVVRSPIDGIVIAGDWKNAAGMPLETGQSLYEVAPLEKLSIDIYLPEDDVRYAQTGQSVRIKFDSYPFESFRGKLDRIHPAAEIQNSDNVFVATVLMENPEGKLRPGMKGKAKCSSVWRPVWWNLLHKPTAKCMRYFGW